MILQISEKIDFPKMQAAGQLARKTLDMISTHIKPGVSTKYLNDLCYNFITENGAFPACLQYKGFPESVCTSVNNICCHGIPSTQVILKEGDIINIDVTVILDGWYGDTSRTFPVGKISSEAQRLIDVAYNAMWKGIQTVKEGAYFGDLGRIVEEYVKSQGYNIARDFCGHGIGKVFHTDPYVLFYYNGNKGRKMIKGEAFTVEPIVNEGTGDYIRWKDQWTIATKDNKLSAQFEHTLGVTERGCVVFTLSEEEHKKMPQYTYDFYLKNNI